MQVELNLTDTIFKVFIKYLYLTIIPITIRSKNMYSYSLTFFLTAYLFLPVYSQEVNFTFNVSQNENDVYLSWKIDRGSTCDGTDIERSFDSTQFDRVGSIYGVCGSADFAQSFSFIDIRPIPNSINYYRLLFGGRQYSNILAIYFVSFNNFGYSVKNNTNNTTIYFLNNSLKSLKFTLADMNGRILSEVDEIIDSKVEFDNNNLHHGFYVFMLTDERGNKLQRGKIFID